MLEDLVTKDDVKRAHHVWMLRRQNLQIAEQLLMIWQPERLTMIGKHPRLLARPVLREVPLAIPFEASGRSAGCAGSGCYRVAVPSADDVGAATGLELLEADELDVWTAGAIIAAACLVLVFLRWYVCPTTRAPRGGKHSGARYERASTAPADGDDDDDDEDEEDDDDDGAVGTSGDVEAADASAGAYDRWAENLCVHVFVPGSNQPVKVEMSVSGVNSASGLLESLRRVVGEVAGWQSALPTDQLSIVYEGGSDGVQLLLTDESRLEEVFAASRIVASVRAAESRPAAWEQQSVSDTAAAPDVQAAEEAEIVAL